MAAWPVTLPDYVMQSNFVETLPNNVIKTQMEVGPAKLRRRSSSAAEPFKSNMYMTTAQVATHDTFYKVTLKYGSLPFDGTHPRTGAASSLRYVKPPSYKASGQNLIVSLDFEVLP